MARDCYETTIALPDTEDGNALKPLSNVKVSVVSRGATDIPASLVTIYQAGGSSLSQGPDPATGATGTNPFTTGASGAVRFWAEGPTKLDIVFEDLNVPARIADRTSWDVMPVSTTIGTTSPPAQPQAAGSIHYRTDIRAHYLSDGANWLLINATAPVGQIAAFALANVVDADGVVRWLLCDGSPCTTSNPVLRQALLDSGSPYGTSGSDPMLPDLRGRVPIGVDGTAARLAANDTLGNSGGAETHSLTAANIPAHGHSFSDRQFPLVYTSNGATFQRIRVNDLGGSGGASVAAQSGGALGDGIFGSTGFTNAPGIRGDGSSAAPAPVSGMQPYQVVNWFIKAKY